MRSHRYPTSADAGGLAPAERLLVLQAATVIAFSSWAAGGSYPWGPPWILALTLLGLPLAFARRREARTIRWLPFAPAVLWAAFCATAIANVSYTVLPTGGWIPKLDWVRWLPAAVDRSRALDATVPWLAVLIEGAVLVACAPTARAVRSLWAVIALNGFALAAVGAFFRFSGAEQMLGFIDPPEPTYFFATFFYKNHWAAYGALSAATALALVMLNWDDGLRRDPRANGRVLLFGSFGLLTLVTLPLPSSRSGLLLGLVIGTSFLVMLVWRRTHDRARRWLALGFGAIAACVIGFGVRADFPQVRADLERTEQQLTGWETGTRDLRLSLSLDTWRMARARPWFGWGPGSFAVVFPRFQGAYLRDASGRPTARVEDAHNDWLQWLAECGFVGTALVLVPAGILATRAARSAPPVGRWVLGVCLLLALYALIDFPFRNPAVAMLWTVLLSTAGAV